VKCDTATQRHPGSRISVKSHGKIRRFGVAAGHAEWAVMRLILYRPDIPQDVCAASATALAGALRETECRPEARPGPNPG